MNDITIDGYAALQDLILQFWWYIEDEDEYDYLTPRERVKIINYFFKNQVEFL